MGSAEVEDWRKLDFRIQRTGTTNGLAFGWRNCEHSILPLAVRCGRLLLPRRGSHIQFFLRVPG